jgi:hypothetical protein
VLEMSRDAQNLFSGFEASFGVQQAMPRSTNDAAQSRLGTAPWHLGILSASKLVWDVAMNEIKETEKLVVQAHHVQRAYDEIRVAYALVCVWSAQPLPRNLDVRIAATLLRCYPRLKG